MSICCEVFSCSEAQFGIRQQSVKSMSKCPLPIPLLDTRTALTLPECARTKHPFSTIMLSRHSVPSLLLFLVSDMYSVSVPALKHHENFISRISFSTTNQSNDDGKKVSLDLPVSLAFSLVLELVKACCWIFPSPHQSY